jgi:hypothetical protein
MQINKSFPSQSAEAQFYMMAAINHFPVVIEGTAVLVVGFQNLDLSTRTDVHFEFKQITLCP